jgi:hypothetical protein
MVDFDYCPKCDKLVTPRAKKCMRCKSKTLKFSAYTSFRGIIVLGCIFGGFIILFILLIYLEDWLAMLLGTLINLAIMGLIIKYVMHDNKKVTEKGRLLYHEYKEKYESGAELDLRDHIINPPTEYPWCIRHVNHLLICIIMCVLLIPVFFVIFVYYKFSIFVFSLFIMSFIMIPLILFLIYKPSKRLANIIKALNLDPSKMVIEQLNTLKVNSPISGQFSVHYGSGGSFPGSRYWSSSYYKIWIPTNKKIPVKKTGEHLIWTKPSILSKLLDKQNNSLLKYLSLFELNEIKALESLKFENTHGENRIVAILDDRWLFSTTPDIVKTLEILKEIKAYL